MAYIIRDNQASSLFSVIRKRRERIRKHFRRHRQNIYNFPVGYLDLDLHEATAAFQRRYLEKQIARFDGNISATAGYIGMERSALHRKCRNLDVKRAR